MAEERVNINLERIEKLIVNGQKEVLQKIQGLDEKVNGLDNNVSGLSQKLENMDKKTGKVEKGLADLTFEIKTLDTSVRAAHYDIKEIDKKLDEHIKQPAH